MGENEVIEDMGTVSGGDANAMLTLVVLSPDDEVPVDSHYTVYIASGTDAATVETLQQLSDTQQMIFQELQTQTAMYQDSFFGIALFLGMIFGAICIAGFWNMRR